jgi:hypothetical protein
MSQPEINIISEIHTSCKDCSFAVYSDQTQTGCELNLIEKYKGKGASIIEAYDAQQEFFIINGKKCIGYRDKKWSAELSMEEKKEKVLIQNNIKYILFIDLQKFTNDKFEKLIDDISSVSIKPSTIILLRYNYINVNFEYEYIRSKLQNSGISCKWRIQTMVDEDVSIRSVLSSTISTNTQYKVMLYVSDYTDIADINKILDLANHTIYEDLASFIVVSNKEHTAKLFLGLIYRYSWLTSGKNILEAPEDFVLIP